MTTYRTLNRLEEAGILRRHDVGDGVARYTFGCHAQHNPLVDVMDGEIEELPDDLLDARIARLAESLGYRLIRYRLVMYGELKGSDSAASAKTMQIKRPQREASKAISPAR